MEERRNGNKPELSPLGTIECFDRSLLFSCVCFTPSGVKPPARLTEHYEAIGALRASHPHVPSHSIPQRALPSLSFSAANLRFVEFRRISLTTALRTEINTCTGRCGALPARRDVPSGEEQHLEVRRAAFAFSLQLNHNGSIAR